ncbi:MAG TPA: hypothetical protein ENI23_00880 [bacterium]|nr:hypothetical protein [bacterium]
MELLKDILAVIGGIALVLGFLRLLFDVLPKLNFLKSKFWKFLSSKIKHRSLEKKAIASNIENVINEAVTDLRKELPSGWINKVSIHWIDKEIRNEVEDEELILRIKPMESQDQNLMNGVFLFFTKALFPGTKEVIPPTIRKASVLHLSQRIISKKQPYIVKKFEKDFIEQSIESDPGIAGYIGDYAYIDKYGYFTSTYMREIHRIADNARYTDMRSRIENEFKGILAHIKDFIDSYPNKTPRELWHRKGESSSYAFLLVAKPFHPDISPYLRRAEQHYLNGIERLYVMGVNQERRFVKRIIKKIINETRYNLLELIELHKDYRGESGGIGAIFDAKALERETEDIVDEFFDKKNDSQ